MRGFSNRCKSSRTDRLKIRWNFLLRFSYYLAFALKISLIPKAIANRRSPWDNWRKAWEVTPKRKGFAKSRDTIPRIKLTAATIINISHIPFMALWPPLETFPLIYLMFLRVIAWRNNMNLFSQCQAFQLYSCYSIENYYYILMITYWACRWSSNGCNDYWSTKR